MTGSSIQLLLSYAVLTCGIYAAWPSKWNVIGHLSLAFGLVAYVPAIAILRVPDQFPADEVRSYAGVVTIGAITYLLGILFGRYIINPAPAAVLTRTAQALEQGDPQALERRVRSAMAVGIVLLASAYIGMGFVPIFAEDPLAAKFFRGEYKSQYENVAVLYRLAWVILPTSITLSLYYALRRRGHHGWRLLTSAAILLLLFTLSRASLAQGVLLFVVTLLVWQRHTVFAILLAVGSYFAGALYYAVLALFGVVAVGGGSGQVLLAEVAASVPDVADGLAFWHRWLESGEPFAYGRTLWGGLIPGNFPWNPGVWSITLGNSAIDISSISSGGLRLPAPVWGYVNFGYAGAAVIPFFAGLASAIVAVMVSHLFPVRRLLSALVLIVFADVIVNGIVGTYYVLSYVGVLEVVLILWIMWPAYKSSRITRGLRT